MQVVFCGTGWGPAVDHIRAVLPEGVTLRVRDPQAPLLEEIGDADVLLPSNARIDAATIAALPKLKLIQQPAAGYEGIDVEAARLRGIAVCNVPDANADSVAQMVMLLVLSLARKFPEALRAFSERRIGVPAGVELGGKCIGIIGRGRTAKRVGSLAASFGMNVLMIGSTSSDADIVDLFTHADFITVHCPLTSKTRGLVGDSMLGLTKKGTYLINCARGAVVDRQAVERALNSGQLAGVALDVHWAEPWEPEDPFYKRSDVIALPHVAGSTTEAFARIASAVAENIRRLQNGELLRHRVA